MTAHCFVHCDGDCKGRDYPDEHCGKRCHMSRAPEEQVRLEEEWSRRVGGSHGKDHDDDDGVVGDANVTCDDCGQSPVVGPLWHHLGEDFCDACWRDADCSAHAVERGLFMCFTQPMMYADNLNIVPAVLSVGIAAHDF
jgi:hypothetical protein